LSIPNADERELNRLRKRLIEPGAWSQWPAVSRVKEGRLYLPQDCPRQAGVSRIRKRGQDNDPPVAMMPSKDFGAGIVSGFAVYIVGTRNRFVNAKDFAFMLLRLR